jgi:hypothetical protein
MNSAIDTGPLQRLHAPGPAADRADKLALYAFLIGSWDAEVAIHPEGAPKRMSRGEIHAGWVLEGRAIQDVWILPGVFHGTTLRVYDPGIDAWHIHWLDPVMQAYPRMTGRAQGADIVQLGRNDAGDTLRWSFKNIAADAFHWSGEISRDGGEHWRLQLEFFARRRGSF